MVVDSGHRGDDRLGNLRVARAAPPITSGFVWPAHRFRSPHGERNLTSKKRPHLSGSLTLSAYECCPRHGSWGQRNVMRNYLLLASTSMHAASSGTNEQTNRTTADDGTTTTTQGTFVAPVDVKTYAGLGVAQH